MATRHPRPRPAPSNAGSQRIVSPCNARTTRVLRSRPSGSRSRATSRVSCSAEGSHDVPGSPLRLLSFGRPSFLVIAVVRWRRHGPISWSSGRLKGRNRIRLRSLGCNSAASSRPRLPVLQRQRHPSAVMTFTNSTRAPENKATSFIDHLEVRNGGAVVHGWSSGRQSRQSCRWALTLWSRPTPGVLRSSGMLVLAWRQTQAALVPFRCASVRALNVRIASLSRR